MIEKKLEDKKQKNDGAPKQHIRIKGILGYKFKNHKYLEEALTHKSYSNEHQAEGIKDNERLEFLGDAILGFIITDLLVKRFPSTNEGVLSRYRSDIVNEKRLAEVARTFELGSKLRFGKGESDSAGYKKDSIVSSALEAVLAAIFQDGGYRATYSVIERLFSPLFEDIKNDNFSKDFKTKLQQYTQEVYKTKPVYKTIKESGPDHNKTFKIEVIIAKESMAIAKGGSKKQAEQNAAEILLKKFMKKKKK